MTPSELFQIFLGSLLVSGQSQSETYTPVFSEDIAQRFSVNYNPAVHGFEGPVQVSYPKYFYNQASELPLFHAAP